MAINYYVCYALYCSIEKYAHQCHVIIHSPHLISNVLFVFWVVVFSSYKCIYWGKCLSTLKTYERYIHEADVTKFVSALSFVLSIDRNNKFFAL